MDDGHGRQFRVLSDGSRLFPCYKEKNDLLRVKPVFSGNLILNQINFIHTILGAICFVGGLNTEETRFLFMNTTYLSTSMLDQVYKIKLVHLGWNQCCTHYVMPIQY